MHSHWNPNYPPPPRNSYRHFPPPPHPHPQNIMPMKTSLEQRLDKLIKLIEENNQLLRSLEQQQNRVVTSGGGSVIVRM